LAFGLGFQMESVSKKTLTQCGLAIAAGFVIFKLFRAKKPKSRKFPGIGKTTFGALNYPVTPTIDHADLFHGQMVQDPYVWLEDPESLDTQAWVEAQNAVSEKYFSMQAKNIACFASKMKEMFSYDKYGTPFRRGDRYFFYKKKGLQNQFVLFQQDSLVNGLDDGTATPLLDLNSLREDGTASLNTVSFSEDGKLLAYAVSFSGSDWCTVFVKDVDTGKDLAGEQIEWCKFMSITWLKNGKGFFYTRYNPPSSAGKDDGAGTETDAAGNQRVFFHKVGTDPKNDAMLYERPDCPKWLFSLEVTDDGKTLFIATCDSCDPVNRLYYFDISNFDPDSPAQSLGSCIKLVDNLDFKYDYLTNIGRKYYFYTNRDAKCYKVVTIEFPEKVTTEHQCPDGGISAVMSRENSTDVVAQDPKGAVLTSVAPFKSGLVLLWSRDVRNELEVTDYNGGERLPISLPAIGSVGAISIQRERSDLFYSFQSFNDPGSKYLCELEERPLSSSLVLATKVPGLQPADYKVEQVFFPSKDGTRIPMFIMSCPTATPKPRSTILYAYGGFNISVTPSFSLSRAIFCKHYGGVYCVANIRGGGEYGEAWHAAGQKSKKQNVFDDFQAAAEYLIKTGVTTTPQLAIEGGSNGGLLVGACLNQRPDLFGCGVAHVGVMDMLKFHKFTIGYAWCSDFGNADENKEDFETLRKYTPYRNVAADKRYPPTIVLTGDHDDRVVPLHSYKYISELQAARGAKQTEPLIIRIDTKSGHGAGKPTSKQIEQAAEVYAFIADATKAIWSN